MLALTNPMIGTEIKRLISCEGTKINAKLQNSVGDSETTGRACYDTVDFTGARQATFFLTGRNAWLSQQISLNSTIKIPGTILIEVVLWFG